jgi:predicted DNA-binding WGR domain protein
MATRRFEFTEATSRKFWEMRVLGTETQVRFGRLGTEGQLKTKRHTNAKAARLEAEKLIREKTGKGYAEVRGARAGKAPAVSATAARMKPAQAKAAKAPAPSKAARTPSRKWLSYEKAGKAWVHFCLKGPRIVFVKGQGGCDQQWDETFASAADAQARAARVVALLEGAKYKLVAESTKKPPLVLGDSLSKPVDEVELDETSAEFRKFYVQSQKDLRPTGRAMDASKLALRWAKLVAALSDREELDLEAKFGKPASAKAIAQTEKVWGVKLPPSLRSFLAVHDGAEILIEYAPSKRNMFFQLCTTKELQESWRHIRDWRKVDEGELIAHLRPLMPFYGDHMLAFDTRDVSKGGEYAVVSFQKRWTPNDYRRLAPDFGSFLSTMIDDFFMLRAEHSQQRFDTVKRGLTKVAAAKRV